MVTWHALNTPGRDGSVDKKQENDHSNNENKESMSEKRKNTIRMIQFKLHGGYCSGTTSTYCTPRYRNDNDNNDCKSSRNNENENNRNKEEKEEY